MMGFNRYDGYGMMGGGGSWFGNLLMLLFGLLLLAGITVLVIWAVRSSIHHGNTAQGGGLRPGTLGGPDTQQHHPGAVGHYEAVAIAKRRLASGEITREQYDEIMRALGA